MEVHAFYEELFRPICEQIGPLDPDTLTSVIGFSAGGPISLCTVGRERGERFATYVTCELALTEGQMASGSGPYELMMTCDDEEWCCDILTRVGETTLELALDHGHTLDIGAWVEPGSRIQGLVVERFSTANIEGKFYSILQLHGVSRSELERAVASGAETVLAIRKDDGTYPRTAVR